MGLDKKYSRPDLGFQEPVPGDLDGATFPEDDLSHILRMDWSQEEGFALVHFTLRNGSVQEVWDAKIPTKFWEVLESFLMDGGLANKYTVLSTPRYVSR